MPAYVYVHGFNSGKGSRSAAMLEELAGARIFCPQMDYSQDYKTCLADLARMVGEIAGGERICLMGTSLGGFYALQLRLPGISRVIAWNPVIYPAVQLAGFVGRNCRFTDNHEWQFQRPALLSYAKAADPRCWNNNGAAGFGPEPARFVVLGIRDTLLDHEVGEAYWQDFASILRIDSPHQIEDFSHALSLLENA